MVEKFRADSKSSCYVNPKAPSEAILLRGNPAFGLMIFLPLIFVAVGGVGMVAMWKRSSGPQKPAPLVLQPKMAGAVTKGAVAFFGLFAVVGALGLYLLFVRPALKMVDARDWNASVKSPVFRRNRRKNRGEQESYLRCKEPDGEFGVNGRHQPQSPRGSVLCRALN